MFSTEAKKKSRITSGLIIIIGIFLMSILVIIDNTITMKQTYNNIEVYKNIK